MVALETVVKIRRSLFPCHLHMKKYLISIYPVSVYPVLMDPVFGTRVFYHAYGIDASSVKMNNNEESHLICCLNWIWCDGNLPSKSDHVCSFCGDILYF